MADETNTARSADAAGHPGSHSDHPSPHDAHHPHPSAGVLDRLKAGLGWGSHTGHSHSAQAAALDPALATDRGIRVLKVSLAALLATAVFQSIIVYISGSRALLADTIHNFSDALTAIPLGLAFWLARRKPDRRYTYGFGRAEDIAGALIVVMILISAVQAIYHSARALFDHRPVENLGWVAAAALIGFAGNELVAAYRIRAGKQINSAALVADGLHARSDGFTSLAVLAGAVGGWLGFPLLDPLIGIGIGITILAIAWNAGKEIALRIMDAVDPELTAAVETTAASVPGVLEVHSVALRWTGHRLRSELHIVVDCQQPTYQSHAVAEAARHALFHALPTLVDITIHADPCECERLRNVHQATRNHLAAQDRLEEDKIK